MEYERPQFYHVMQYAADADGDVIDMVSGNPDWEPPAALRDGLREYADADPADFQYPPSEGLVDLRAEIADRRNVDPERVVVTNGTGEANYLAMAGALDRDAGDEVLLTDPVYPYYPGKASMLGAETTLVPTERDGSLDPERFREAASDDTALIVVNTPNNPTGTVYDRETMRALADLAEEVDATLLADEVYDHFDFTGGFESALTLDSDRTIVTTGYSKSMAITGFRVGYAVFPEDLVGSAKTRHMLVNVATSRPAQYAVLRALRGTDADYYAGARELLSQRVETFTDALDAAGAEYTSPDGAFYVLARFDGFPGTMANAERLVDEAGVAGMPGETFGTTRSEWLRFALVTPRVEEAAARLTDYFG
ncbi:pyridoxal phosphate-dependent aminotransferase [Candidatus Halobonum tyrrellensis]|uniref:Aminotransferase n=1 Tax=Candidatus Halobonum tyrrellensis G22 TaxID=1324957 RepID=V4HPR9_9EURY|nr:pyridoxal phosphate-dependent aminotransferase [Candidatus Halobonum tyrrellensis]ESP89904.1 class I and II aminotransferase [Candidatus Halobonum tyrrellensis G22]